MIVLEDCPCFTYLCIFILKVETHTNMYINTYIQSKTELTLFFNFKPVSLWLSQCHKVFLHYGIDYGNKFIVLCREYSGEQDTVIREI